LVRQQTACALRLHHLAALLDTLSKKQIRDTKVFQLQESFGYCEGESVGRSMKMIEGPLTQYGTLLSLYEALGSGAPMQCKLVTYRADGRPLINHIRAVPVLGDLIATPLTQLVQHAQGSGSSGSQLMAHAPGVTHCLWYMETHEPVLHTYAMSDAFYANSSKIMTAPHAVEEQRTVQRELLVYHSDGKPLVQRFRVHPVIDVAGDVTNCIALVDQSMSHALDLATRSFRRRRRLPSPVPRLQALLLPSSSRLFVSNRRAFAAVFPPLPPPPARRHLSLAC
jgi:hypothetical protein